MLSGAACCEDSILHTEESIYLFMYLFSYLFIFVCGVYLLIYLCIYLWRLFISVCVYVSMCVYMCPFVYMLIMHLKTSFQIVCVCLAG